MGVLERKETEQDIENLFAKLVTENFPNLVMETDTSVQEAQRVPNKKKARRPTPRHSIIKMAEI